MAPMASKSRTLDALTSSTLKHVREEWWDNDFTSFLVERLKPRVGNRILHVGCGTGTVELQLSRLRIPQVIFIGIDRIVERTIVAERTTDGHNLRASFAAADAGILPFPDATFDSTFCVAVLQHVGQPGEALGEFARVTRPGGRILAVEPDNAARYWYSSLPQGMAAYRAGRRFFEAQAALRGEALEPRLGPRLPTLFGELGIELLEVQLFPVSVTWLGAQDQRLWSARKQAIESAIDRADDGAVRSSGEAYLQALADYKDAAGAAGRSFVEIQSTLLFAVVGQRGE